MSTTNRGPSYYELLGVDESASTEEVKKAYRRLVRRVHPDVAGAGMENLFTQLTQAHDVLTDPRRRAEYDAADPELGSEAASEPEPEPEPWGQEEVVEEPVVDDPAVRGHQDEPARHHGQGDRVAPPAPTSSWKARLRATRTPVALTMTTLLAIYVFLADSTLPLPRSWNTSLVGALAVGCLIPLMLLRIFRRSGKVSLFLLVAFTLLQFADEAWALVIASVLTMIVAELWRNIRKHRRTEALARQWHAFEAAAGDRLRWVRAVAPHGQRTLALLQNPYTMESRQQMIWGVVRAHVWIVLDDANVVQAVCANEPRQAFLRLYG